MTKSLFPNNPSYKNLNTIILLLIVLLGISCGTKKNLVQEETIKEQNPKLLFLNYTISKDEKGKKTIQFINKIITDGKAKSNNNKLPITGIKGDLKCSQLDIDSTEINYLIIKNPLLKTIESLNDSLIFENKTVILKKTSMSLRLQLHSKTRLIVISEIIDSLQNSNPLITTKLDEL